MDYNETVEQAMRESAAAERAANEPDTPPVIPFAAFLQDLRGGVAHAELTDGLRDVVEAVARYHGKGSLTLKIDVKPAAENDGSQVLVTHEVVVKAPQPAAPVSFFFVDTAHNLRRDDPTRMVLPLREVPPQESTEIREVGQ